MAGKRELIGTGTDKRYVRRDDKGRFRESDDLGRSVSRDVTMRAERVATALRQANNETKTFTPKRK
jgi:hypothetical protein